MTEHVEIDAVESTYPLVLSDEARLVLVMLLRLGVPGEELSRKKQNTGKLNLVS